VTVCSIRDWVSLVTPYSWAGGVGATLKDAFFLVEYIIVLRCVYFVGQRMSGPPNPSE